MKSSVDNIINQINDAEKKNIDSFNSSKELKVLVNSIKREHDFY